MKVSIASNQKLDLNEDDLIKIREKMFNAGMASYSVELNTMFDELIKEFTTCLEI
jgi:hypothetical protein